MRKSSRTFATVALCAIAIAGSALATNTAPTPAYEFVAVLTMTSLVVATSLTSRGQVQTPIGMANQGKPHRDRSFAAVSGMTVRSAADWSRATADRHPGDRRPSGYVSPLNAVSRM
jgi:hypothetical protein